MRRALKPRTIRPAGLRARQVATVMRLDPNTIVTKPKEPIIHGLMPPIRTVSLWLVRTIDAYPSSPMTAPIAGIANAARVSGGGWPLIEPSYE
jgi:hypothetical protein